MCEGKVTKQAEPAHHQCNINQHILSPIDIHQYIFSPVYLLLIGLPLVPVSHTYNSVSVGVEIFEALFQTPQAATTALGAEITTPVVHVSKSGNKQCTEPC